MHAVCEATPRRNGTVLAERAATMTPGTTHAQQRARPTTHEESDIAGLLKEQAIVGTSNCQNLDLPTLEALQR